MPAFAVTIPQGALRRSWLGGPAAGAFRAGVQFARLVRALAPRRAVDPRNPIACYEALMEECSNRFPVYEQEFAAWDVDEDPQDFAYMLDYGIPIAPIGCEAASTESVVEAFVAAELDIYNHGPAQVDRIRDVYSALADVDLTWWAGPVRVVDENNLWGPAYRLPLPKGRAWSGAWRALPDLLEYVTGSTGNGFLDWTPSQMDDGGEMPRWNMGEIQACTRAWKEAEQLLDRIGVLKFTIDDDLQLLDRVLRGDAQALRAVTHPKQGKTLVDVLR